MQNWKWYEPKIERTNKLNAKKRKKSLAQFIRDVVFSYIKDDELGIKKVDSVKMVAKMKAIRNSLKFVLSDLDEIEIEISDDFELEEADQIWINDYKKEVKK